MWQSGTRLLVAVSLASDSRVNEFAIEELRQLGQVAFQPCVCLLLLVCSFAGASEECSILTYAMDKWWFPVKHTCLPCMQRKGPPPRWITGGFRWVGCREVVVGWDSRLDLRTT